MYPEPKRPLKWTRVAKFASKCIERDLIIMMRYEDNIFERVKKNHADLAWNSPDFDVEHGP